jgi:hypothetical protein
VAVERYGLAVAVTSSCFSSLFKGDNSSARATAGLSGDAETSSRPPRLNLQLKESQSKSGLSHKERIIMAKGPPSDSIKGFPQGWRLEPDTKTLPWGHLLAHLVTRYAAEGTSAAETS